MEQNHILPVFIGGYTKSGTTYIGRAFDTLTGVYARGESDYFRLIFDSLHKSLVAYSKNIQVVNKEVYDDRGTLEPITNKRAQNIQSDLFTEIFFNGQGIPSDCRVIVDKSPRNIFHVDQIRFVFPHARIVCVFRDPVPVFQSLIRHMGDNRDKNYYDPTFKGRKDILDRFTEFRWPKYADILKREHGNLFVVRYDQAAKDPEGFLDFAETKVIGQKLGRDRGVETLTKDYYLASLPPEIRAKSLVQSDSVKKVTLTEEEKHRLVNTCEVPDIPFGF